MDEVAVGDPPVADDLLRGVAGETERPLAHELHRPPGVGPAPVGHTREVAHQGGEVPFAPRERLDRLPQAGGVLRAEEVGIRAPGVGNRGEAGILRVAGPGGGEVAVPGKGGQGCLPGGVPGEAGAPLPGVMEDKEPERGRDGVDRAD